ncbi:DUF4198 domain-containing protein [Vibrio sp. 404]|uniref:DUF4198 domain-containing protein n=1 Tax=Vibrio marinisediminis TaxID=2758441 RepID=A0A7W2ISJ9_9VIBR|nr:DUF4198 domain-containing protein [Vibrio marinisediminis]MBA5761440.1 DUF4198 domain-containing protein [Vibrio marinisediminis]
MKKIALVAGAVALTLSAASQAHFQLMYTPTSQLEKPTTLDMKLVFGHPMENGHVMDMGQPEQFFVMFKDKKSDLLKDLKKITWSGHDNKAAAYQIEYKARRNGDYIFGLVPAPYYEGGEDIYIQQITKRYINKGGLPTGWDAPVGLKTEIVPKNKPYQIFAGSTFTGQLLSEGKPKAGVECEIEFINTDIDTKANAFGQDKHRATPASAIVAVTDEQGMFTFGIPTAGKWGLACLGSGPDTEFKGKELSQDAVLWIEAQNL